MSKQIAAGQTGGRIVFGETHAECGKVSDVFNVGDTPVMLRAFCMGEDDYFTLEMMWGCNHELQCPVKIDGHMLQLTHNDNMLVIPFSGVYRLCYHGEAYDCPTVVASETCVKDVDTGRFW